MATTEREARALARKKVVGEPGPQPKKYPGGHSPEEQRMEKLKTRRVNAPKPTPPEVFPDAKKAAPATHPTAHATPRDAEKAHADKK
jgi:hypothetical protein